MKKLMPLLIAIAVVTAALYFPLQKPEVTNFEECVRAVYPIIETFPRQCMADGKTFVENVVNAPLESLVQVRIGQTVPDTLFQQNLEDIFPPVPGTKVSLVSDPFGVHFGRKNYLWVFRNEVSKLVQRAHDMGVDWIRIHFNWPDIETTKDVYDWHVTDNFVNLAESLGITLLVDIEGYPEMTFYNENEKATKYNEFVKALVRRYKDKIDYWKIENEVLAENSGFGPDKMDEFARILQAAYETIKVEDPSAKVVLSGFGSSKLDQIFYSDKKGPQAREDILNLFSLTKDFYDIFDVHLYHNPDDAGRKIELVQQLMQEAGYSTIKPIWVGETAGPDLRYWDPDFADDPDDDSQDFPANQGEREIVQRIITVLSYGAKEVERVAWHKMWLAREKTDNLMHAALVDTNLNPTNLFYVYKHLINKIRGAQEMEKIDLGRDVVAFHFIKPDRDVYVLWSVDPQRPVRKSLGLEQFKGITITDVTGQNIENEREITIGSTAIFIEILKYDNNIILAHRLQAGNSLNITINPNNVLRPANRKTLGVSFFLAGDGDADWKQDGKCRAGLPIDRNGVYRLSEHPCGNFENAVSDLKLQMTRVYDLAMYDRWQQAGKAYENWYVQFDARKALDLWAGLAGRLGIPQENIVIGLELYTTQDDREMIYPTAQFWRGLVDYSVHQGYKFRYWEVGNEVYNPIKEEKTNFILNGFFDRDGFRDSYKMDRNVERFSRYFIEVSKAIHSVQPEAQIGLSILGPDDGVKRDTWTDKVIRATAGYYDFLVGHYYHWGPSFVGDDKFEEFTLAQNYALMQVQLTILQRAQSGSQNKTIYHYDTEWGAGGSRDSSWNIGSEVRNGNTYGALMRAVRLVYYLREGVVEGAGTWNMFTRDIVNNPAFGLLTHESPDQRSMIYWLYYYFQQFTGDFILNITGTAPYYYGSFKHPLWSEPISGDGPYTPVLASKSANGERLFLIIPNANENRDYDLQITLLNLQGKSVKSYLLKDYRSGYWKDNNPFSPNQGDFVRSFNSISLSNDGKTLKSIIPAHSVLFIEVELENDATNINEKIKNLERDMNILNRRIDTVEKEIDAVHKRLDNVEAEIDNVSKNIGSLEQKVTILENNVAANVTALRGLIDMLRQENAALRQRITAAEKNQTMNILYLLLFNIVTVSTVFILARRRR